MGMEVGRTASFSFLKFEFLNSRIIEAIELGILHERHVQLFMIAIHRIGGT